MLTMSAWIHTNLIVVIVVVIAIIGAIINVITSDKKWIGRRGEKLTARELKLSNLFGRTGKILQNIYVPVDNGQTSEIDLVYITQKGIFVLESKNFSGWIFGDEEQPYWTVVLPNKQKNRFYNPILQNKTHIKRLQEYLQSNGFQAPMFSVVVFSERCKLKKITVSSGTARVIKRDRLYDTVRTIWDKTPDVLSSDVVDAIFAQLHLLTQADDVIKEQHVRHIKEQYASPPSPTPLKAEEMGAMICPRCGKPLVLRTAKKGVNAGKQFYGCTGYPQCRYIRNMNG